MSLVLRSTPAALALLLAEAAYARTQVLKTHAGSVVHWSQPEISVGIDATATSQKLHPLDALLALQRAMATWNRIPADQPRFVLAKDGQRDVSIRFCRGQWQGDTIDLGRTQFEAHPRNGSVTTATVELNECDHRLAPPGDTAAERLDLQSVMTHELGHVLGLGHGDARDAVMFPSGSGTTTRVPSADDETALAAIYLGRQPPRPAAAAVASGREGGPATVRTASGLAPALEARKPAQAPPARAPADSVSVLSLTGSGGREVMIYTCEPTLLPPIAESQPAKNTPRIRPHGRRNAR